MGARGWVVEVRGWGWVGGEGGGVCGRVSGAGGGVCVWGRGVGGGQPGPGGRGDGGKVRLFFDHFRRRLVLTTSVAASF